MVALNDSTAIRSRQDGIDLFNAFGRLSPGEVRNRFLDNAASGSSVVGLIALARPTSKGIKQTKEKKRRRFRQHMWALIQQQGDYYRNLYLETRQNLTNIEKMTDSALASLDLEIGVARMESLVSSKAHGRLARLLGRKTKLQRFKSQTLDPLKDKFDNPPLPDLKALENVSEEVKGYGDWLMNGFAHCLTPFKGLRGGFTRSGAAALPRRSYMASNFNHRGDTPFDSSGDLELASVNDNDGDDEPKPAPDVTYDDDEFRIA